MPAGARCRANGRSPRGSATTTPAPREPDAGTNGPVEARSEGGGEPDKNIGCLDQPCHRSVVRVSQGQRCPGNPSEEWRRRYDQARPSADRC